MFFVLLLHVSNIRSNIIKFSIPNWWCLLFWSTTYCLISRRAHYNLTCMLSFRYKLRLRLFLYSGAREKDAINILFWVRGVCCGCVFVWQGVWVQPRVRARVCPRRLAVQVCACEGALASEGQPRQATELVKSSLSKSWEGLEGQLWASELQESNWSEHWSLPGPAGRTLPRVMPRWFFPPVFYWLTF